MKNILKEHPEIQFNVKEVSNGVKSVEYRVPKRNSAQATKQNNGVVEYREFVRNPKTVYDTRVYKTKDLTKQEHLEMYELMQLIRDFDMELSKLYSRGLVHGMTHYSVGEEAANVGAIYPLRKEDLMYSNHRGHGQTIAKGIEIDRMMAEILGKETGQCKGRGGSMHVYDLEQGNMGCNGIVGGGHGLSTGAALAQKMKKTGNVVICCMGDGATNEGSFHECLNMASNWDLPLIFYVINNKYGISMAQERCMRVKDITERAASYRIKGIHVEDGNDVLAVYDAMQEAIDHARSGKGPVLVEAVSYRWFGHSASDAGKYRSREEVAEWKLKDPNVKYRNYLLENGIATEAELKEIEDRSKATIDDAVEFAKESKVADGSIAFQDNYAD